MTSEPDGVATNPRSGLVHLASRYSVDQTLQRLEKELQERSVIVFALIDHSGEAAKVGLAMRPTKLLVFGSPQQGTPVMEAAPTVAIDLPLKALVWEDAAGRVWLTYNDLSYLRDRHGISENLLANLAAPNALFAKVVG